MDSPSLKYHKLVPHAWKQPLRLLLACCFIVTVPTPVLQGQVVQFTSEGLEYQALTRNGLTIMYARMPAAIQRYGVLQVAVSNGGKNVRTVQTVDFVFHPEDGEPVRAVSSSEVINSLFRRSGYDEVVKLQQAYERILYGNQRIRSNNGYETRRMSALAFGDKGLKAAAAASAIAFVTSELSSGDSTDGAVFFPNGGRQLGPGHLVAVIEGMEFEFRSL